MASDSDREVAVDQIETIVAAWQEYVDANDPSVLADHFTEDVLFSPPEGTPVRGKDAVLAALAEHDHGAVETEIAVDELIVGEELAVARFTERITAIPDDVDERDELVYSSLDVFQRQGGGSWKQLMWYSNSNH